MPTRLGMRCRDSSHAPEAVYLIKDSLYRDIISFCGFSEVPYPGVKTTLPDRFTTAAGSILFVTMRCSQLSTLLGLISA